MRLNVGLYYVFINEWVSVITRARLHALRLEDFSEDRDTEMDKITNFLRIGELDINRMCISVSISRFTQLKCEMCDGYKDVHPVQILYVSSELHFLTKYLHIGDSTLFVIHCAVKETEFGFPNTLL